MERVTVVRVARCLGKPETDHAVIAAKAWYEKATAEHDRERQRMHDVYHNTQLLPTAEEKARDRQLSRDESKTAKALEKFTRWDTWPILRLPAKKNRKPLLRNAPRKR